MAPAKRRGPASADNRRGQAGIAQLTELCRARQFTVSLDDALGYCACDVVRVVLGVGHDILRGPQPQADALGPSLGAPVPGDGVREIAEAGSSELLLSREMLPALDGPMELGEDALVCPDSRTDVTPALCL
jgi:hypothetical protein